MAVSVGRPTKFTPQTIEQLARAIRLGATFDLAAKSAGISVETLRQWRDGKGFPKGTTAEQKLAFVGAIEKAEGDAALHWLTKIEEAANDGAWQAAAWKLERRYSTEYGRQIRDVNHTGVVTFADLAAIAGRDGDT